MARPPYSGAIDLTPELLNALKAKGPNERGRYSLDFACWEARERRSDNSPTHTGSVKIKGDRDGTQGKGYASMWVNDEGDAF